MRAYAVLSGIVGLVALTLNTRIALGYWDTWPRRLEHMAHGLVIAPAVAVGWPGLVLFVGWRLGRNVWVRWQEGKA